MKDRCQNYAGTRGLIMRQILARLGRRLDQVMRSALTGSSGVTLNEALKFQGGWEKFILITQQIWPRWNGWTPPLTLSIALGLRLDIRTMLCPGEGHNIGTISLESCWHVSFSDEKTNILIYQNTVQKTWTTTQSLYSQYVIPVKIDKDVAGKDTKVLHFSTWMYRKKKLIIGKQYNTKQKLSCREI